MRRAVQRKYTAEAVHGPRGESAEDESSLPVILKILRLLKIHPALPALS